MVGLWDVMNFQKVVDNFVVNSERLVGGASLNYKLSRIREVTGETKNTKSSRILLIKMRNNNKVYLVSELCQLLGLKIGTVYRLIDKKTPPDKYLIRGSKVVVADNYHESTKLMSAGFREIALEKVV